MSVFSSDGVDIAYTVEGEGDPILLIHGFASNAATNWKDTGWTRWLTGNGFRVVTFDNRGHGASSKLYEPDAYAGPVMAEDARRLLDHLDIARADVMGYSMGARIAAFLALAHPERVRRAIFAGLGANMISGVGDPQPIADALMADDPAAVADANARGFRIFADQTKSDRRALAACIKASRDRIPGDELATLTMPVLVAVGTDDTIAGPPGPLADAIRGAKTLDIPGRDHMKAVGDRAFKDGVLTFLRQGS
ncbi:alpha/beta hydrolase fold protein [Rhodomicrobium vannielii ATCC 17100]|uniref:Alpha/beta hydrolase fold protein n=1 Tax=Rhodomicrobium vannielii (strain ATCC 17100 / DSM 162 / LMG 4299 / NCIMB 10020 / ATH 3.1.1) TaxID=648757 RepID=E3I311_RHOVT|nr:alpha/beta hydrolase [Rhodomicrobium vannielii]ADP70305.1 alpha/beta hydrolase fold protein [Rhodomicrobium vannielii ATCC 17100]